MYTYVRAYLLTLTTQWLLDDQNKLGSKIYMHLCYYITGNTCDQ